MTGAPEQDDGEALVGEVIDPDSDPESDIDPDEAEEILFRAARFRGPLPPPGLFREYEDVLPGAADRILSMAEDETTHRHAVALRALDIAAENQPGRRFGVLAGLVLALALAAIAFAMVIMEYAWPAVAVILIKVAAMVGMFIYGMRERPDPPGAPG
ncbi:MAG: DUF2335 domain-containing protein [Chloroflexi bacterium]|nr:DUF2335 domain-containing protein [Chloroflexota bacterium]